MVLRPLTAADVCSAGSGGGGNDGKSGSGGGDGVVFTRDTPFLVRNSP